MNAKQQHRDTDSLASLKKRLFDGDDSLPDQLVAKRQKTLDLHVENAEPQSNLWEKPLPRDADLAITGPPPRMPEILVDRSLCGPESSNLKCSRVSPHMGPPLPKPALIRRNSADLCKPFTLTSPVKKPHRPCRPPPESPSPMKFRHLTPNRYNSVPPLIANPYSPQKMSAEELSSVRGAKESRYATDFIELKEIGRGGFGSVFECRHVVDGWVYAVKRSIRQLRGQSELRQGLKEVFALASLPAHPNVVRYYGSWLEDEHLFIQTELCSGGSLSDLMGTLDEAVLLDYLRGAASGIAHIHMHDLVHMDIKPDNIYLTADRVLKIGDFGLSDRSTSLAEFEDGDGKYLAPELLEESPPSLKKADVFALGAAFLELARGRPLPSRGERWHEIREGKFELPGFSNEFVDLLKEMMDPLPEKRPTALALLQKPILGTTDQTVMVLLEGQRAVNSRLIKELEDMKRIVQTVKNQVLGEVAV